VVAPGRDAYFPSKESVLFGDFDPAFQDLADHLDARAGEDLLDTVRAWIVELIERGDFPTSASGSAAQSSTPETSCSPTNGNCSPA
jgi:hypothetical protein